jgi:hypothetical protein
VSREDVGVERPVRPVSPAPVGRRLPPAGSSRQRRLQGIDNHYHALHVLATRSLAYRAHMQDLIPEWTSTASVRVELERPDGSMAAVELRQPGSDPAEARPRSRVVLPAVGEAGFRTAFLRRRTAARRWRTFASRI